MSVAGSSNHPKTKRIFLLDDHPLVREWLAGLIALEPDLEICGQADEASAALTLLDSARADIVVVDLSLPRSSGLEFIKQMRAAAIPLALGVLQFLDGLELHEAE